MISISVIVPVYNREKLVVRCLDSIFNQEVKPYEIIVVDNNSTDYTYEVVENWMATHKDSGIKLKLLKEEKQGACFARQRGLQDSKGQFVQFFDSDDEMLPMLFSKALSYLKKDRDVELICWKACIHQLNGKSRIPPFDPENSLENHLIHTLLRPQGYMIQKKLLEKIGGWSKPINVWNDFEIGLRILFENPRIGEIPDVLVNIYSQEESITGKDFSSKEGQWEETLKIMQEENDSHNHPQKNKIRKILDYRRAILAAHYFREGNKEGASNLMKSTTRGKSRFEKLLLGFSYHYTRMGFRGAWRLVRRFYN